jgi:hypothetical protein
MGELHTTSMALAADQLHLTAARELDFIIVAVIALALLAVASVLLETWRARKGDGQ